MLHFRHASMSSHCSFVSEFASTVRNEDRQGEGRLPALPKERAIYSDDQETIHRTAALLCVCMYREEKDEGMIDDVYE